MFRIKSSCKTQIEIKASADRVREFFSDFVSFTELLPGVEGIRREPGGIARWTIATDTPVGRIRLTLPVRQTTSQPDLIEWSPAANESENLLRYSVRFAEHNGATLVRISQQVELRRERARDLHPALGLIGEARVSAGVQRRINEAIENFLARAKAKLEAGSADVPSA